jgi:hypothetical protein
VIKSLPNSTIQSEPLPSRRHSLQPGVLPCYDALVPPICKRRLLSFIVRTLLVAVTILCVGLGWVAWQYRIIAHRAELVALIEKSNGVCEPVGDFVLAGYTLTPANRPRLVPPCGCCSETIRIGASCCEETRNRSLLHGLLRHFLKQLCTCWTQGIRSSISAVPTWESPRNDGTRLSMPLLPRRRWLRFSVRTLMVAVTIFCVWLGWQVHRVRERRAIYEAIEAESGLPLVEPYSVKFEHPRRTDLDISWWRSRLGDRYYASLTMLEGGQYTYAEVARLFPEARVDVVTFDPDCCPCDPGEGIDEPEISDAEWGATAEERTPDEEAALSR